MWSCWGPALSCGAKVQTKSAFVPERPIKNNRGRGACDINVQSFVWLYLVLMYKSAQAHLLCQKVVLIISGRRGSSCA